MASQGTRGLLQGYGKIITFVRGILHLGWGSERKRLHALDVVPIVTGHLGDEKQ